MAEFENKNQNTGTTDTSLVSEFRDFLLQTKKWWLLPIVVTLLALAALVFLSRTAVSPSIYTLY